MSRFGLSERTAIEAGIYRRASFAQIAKEIGTTARSVSEEIRRNRTLSPAAKFNGKDCRFAAECTRQCVCGDRFCRHECVFCRKIDCRTVCSGYAPLSCKRIDTLPYVCNVCQLRRGCSCDRAYYAAAQAHVTNKKYRETRTYDDFLAYMRKHPDTNYVEMDTVLGKQGKGKRMLTMLFVQQNLMLIFLMRDGKASSVVEHFDWLTSTLGIKTFRKLFPVILTDNRQW